MKLLLSRHGNTFGPNDPVVWAGATNDLPLVEKGFDQAKAFAQRLLRDQVIPKAIYCSALQRTRDYAEVIIRELQLKEPPILDSRIHEIDYGQWTGLTNAEVISRFGKKALENWDERSIWPEVGNWGGSAERAQQDVASFVRDLSQRYGAEDTVVVVTSNGRLRFFLSLDPGEFLSRVKNKAFKVKTGNICKMTWTQDSVRLDYWNEDPKQIARL